MLIDVLNRQKKLGLSTRKLAKQLEVSASLLSQVITGNRQISKNMADRMARWLATPMVSGGDNHPTTVYKNFMAERSSFVSPATMKYYKEKLSPFLVWCEDNELNDMSRIGREQIGQFLAHIRKGRMGKPLNNGGLKLHHQTLDTLFRYAGETCVSDKNWVNPVAQIHVKHGDAHRSAFSDQELDAVRQVIEQQADPEVSLRNLAIFTVLLNSGMRASELLSMKVESYSSDGLVQILGKGSKRRTVTIGRSGVEALDAYLEVRTFDNPYVWLSIAGNHINRNGLKQIMRQINEKVPAISDRVFAHRFRHTAITNMLKAGVPLRAVQLYAGHSNPQTTLRYAHALDSQLAIDWVNNH